MEADVQRPPSQQREHEIPVGGVRGTDQDVFWDSGSGSFNPPAHDTQHHPRQALGKTARSGLTGAGDHECLDNRMGLQDNRNGQVPWAGLYIELCLD